MLTAGLQRNIPMLLRRVFVALAIEHLERLDQFFAGLSWADYRINVASLGGYIRIGEAVAEFFGLLFAHGGHGGFADRRVGEAVGGFFQLAFVDDVDRAFRAHDGDFGGGPGVIDIGADVLA